MADRAPITGNTEGVAKTEAAPVPKYAIGQDVLERVTSLQSTSEFIYVLAEVIDSTLRDFKEMVAKHGGPSGWVAKCGEWGRTETLLNLLMIQADIVKEVSQAAELAHINAEAAA